MSNTPAVWRVYVMDYPDPDNADVACWRRHQIVRRFAVPARALRRVARLIASTLVLPHNVRQQRYDRWIADSRVWCHRYVVPGRQHGLWLPGTTLALAPASSTSVYVYAPSSTDAYAAYGLSPTYDNWSSVSRDEIVTWLDDRILYQNLRSVL